MTATRHPASRSACRSRRSRSTFAANLFCQNSSLGRRGRRVAAALVPVPEAPVNEAHCPEPSEHEIGRSRELPDVQAEPETTGVKGAAKHELGLGVPAAYPGHHSRTCGAVHDVRHLWYHPRAKGFEHRRVSDPDSFRIKSGPLLASLDTGAVRDRCPFPSWISFPGPGGLAEGFSACPAPDGGPGFRVAVSVEKDPAAHRTLLLRAFLRKFGTAFPPEYHDFLNGHTDGEPDWSELYPRHWSEALDETRCLELGRLDASMFLRDRIELIRAEHGGRTVLLGGPPCQSYSVAGRARNVGNASYDPDSDDRQSLYKEYVDVLRQLRPAVAVMENVKGMLSAQHAGRPIFPDVMRALERGNGSEGYRLYALAPQSGELSLEEGPSPRDFLVRAEEHGVPQTRHRLFVVCIRRDIAGGLPEDLVPRLGTEPNRSRSTTSSDRCRIFAAA